MKSLLLLAIIIVVIIIIFCCCKWESLTGKTVVILHYTEWCPHCQKMKPVWAAIKRELAKTRPDIVMKENDEDKTPTPGVRGYPTIYLVEPDGMKYQYSGGPDPLILRHWIISPRHY